MGKVQTVQATGKLWKSIQLIGALGMIAAIGYAISIGIAPNATETDTAKAIAIGVVGGGFSFLVSFAGRLGAWWFHG